MLSGGVMVDGGQQIPGLERLERIGTGGFGAVYRAWQPEFGRWVAVKVISDAIESRDDRRRFERELLASGSLSSHPNIVTVHDHGITEDGRPYIVMELLDGGSLAARLAAGPLPAEEVLALGVQLAGALTAAHDAGVIHRDVKPENVLFSAYGTPALADFGIARLPGATATRSGVVTASLAHAPPEVLGGGTPTAAADVYGLASTLWAAAVGRPPFDRGPEEPLAALIARIVSEPVAAVSDATVPPELQTVLRLALAKDPADRPATAAALATALQTAQEELGLPITQTTSPGAGHGRPVAGPTAAGRAATDALVDATRPRPAVAVARPVRWRRWPALATVFGVLVLAGAGAWAAGRGADRPAPTVLTENDGAEVESPSPTSSGSGTPSPSPTRGAPSSPAAPSASAVATVPGEGSATGNVTVEQRPVATGGGGGGTDDDGGTQGSDDGPVAVPAPTSPQSPATSAPPPTSSPSSPSPSPVPPSPSPSPSPSPANRAPTAVYTTRVASGTDTVTFDGSQSSDPDGEALTYLWRFNDGTADKSGKVVTHTFTSNADNNSSVWTVTLVVTDARGLTSSAASPASVAMPNVHNMDSGDAFQAVRGAGLRPFYSPAWNTTTSFGSYRVWSQWPGAGSTVSGDANVRIVVWEEDTCASNPNEQFAHWWCYEDPPPSPTLDKSYF